MKKIRDILIPSLVIAFFFSLFIPINTYIGNVGEFPQTRPLILLVVSVFICLALTFLLTIILWMVTRLGRFYVLCIYGLLGLLVAFYLQGNLINLDYGVLDGHKIDWEGMIGLGVVNLLIWEIVIVGAIGIGLWLGKRAVEIAQKAFAIFGGYLLLLLVLQLLGMNWSPIYPISYNLDGFMSVAKERNVFVFIVDTFEKDLFDELLKAKPDVKEMLSGFTYYMNVIGKYPTTKGALPHILTGVENDNSRPFTEYKEHAFLTSRFLKNVSESQFDLSIFTSSVFAPSEKAINEVGCIKNGQSETLTLSDCVNWYIQAVNSSEFAYFPHFIKKYSDRFALKRLSCKHKIDRQEITPNIIEDRFLEEMRGGFKNIKVGESARGMKIYHFWGVHPPQYNIQKGYRCLVAISQFLKGVEQLCPGKRIDAVIMADHGHIKVERPLFLLKNSGNGFSVDGTPFSYDDFHDVLSAALKDEKLSILKSDGRFRVFNFYSWDNVWSAQYLPRIFKKKYDLQGHFVGVDQIEENNVFEGAGLAPLAVSGIVVDTIGEKSWLWTVGHASELRVPLSNKVCGKDIKVSLATKALLSDGKKRQRMKVRVNGKQCNDELYEHGKTEWKTIIIDLPKGVNTNAFLDIALQVDSPLIPQRADNQKTEARPLGVMIYKLAIELAGEKR